MSGYQYKIVSASSRNEDDRVVYSKLIDNICFLKHIKVGSSAVIVYSNGEEKSARTSTVEEISIWENIITITTLNSIYRLESIGGV